MVIDLPYTVAPTELAWTLGGIVTLCIIGYMIRFWANTLKQLLDAGLDGRAQLQVLERVTMLILLGLTQVAVIISGSFAMVTPPPTPRIEVTPAGIAVAVSILFLEVCISLVAILTVVFWKVIRKKSIQARERSTDRETDSTDASVGL